MRIAIVTLQLHTNYGGVLQAFALQRTLEKMGNVVEIIQMEDILPEPEGLTALRKIITRTFRRYVLGQKNAEPMRERRVNREFATVGAEFVRFFDKYLNIRRISSFKEILPSDYDAFVVGSDQVWRPVYNSGLLHSYLDFTWDDMGRRSGKAEGWDVRRIAYAVSFGCDVWEYTGQQTAVAGRLAQRFNALSFREMSGVENARKYLGVSSVAVLDPTLLLSPEEYLDLVGKPAGCDAAADVSPVSVDSCQRNSASGSGKGYVFEYILDGDAPGIGEIENAAGLSGRYETRRFLRADPRGRGDISGRVQPSAESWIEGMAGASAVITDSFHACVFAVIFHKPFIVVGNRKRGLSRVQWLLGQLGLDSCFVDCVPGKSVSLSGAAGQILNGGPDWDEVDRRLRILRSESLAFLEHSLEIKDTCR